MNTSIRASVALSGLFFIAGCLSDNQAGFRDGKKDAEDLCLQDAKENQFAGKDAKSNLFTIVQSKPNFPAGKSEDYCDAYRKGWHSAMKESARRLSADQIHQLPPELALQRSEAF